MNPTTYEVTGESNDPTIVLPSEIVDSGDEVLALYEEAEPVSYPTLSACLRAHALGFGDIWPASR